jgi:hypothetical protein
MRALGGIRVRPEPIRKALPIVIPVSGRLMNYVTVLDGGHMRCAGAKPAHSQFVG